MIDRLDKYWLGILFGLILPAAFGVIYISHFHLWYVFHTFGLGMRAVLSKLLFVSVFPNLALIFLFYTMDAWKLSKGVLIGAFPYILAAIALSI
jgi:hypothetical protein